MLLAALIAGFAGIGLVLYSHVVLVCRGWASTWSREFSFVHSVALAVDATRGERRGKLALMARHEVLFNQPPNCFIERTGSLYRFR